MSASLTPVRVSVLKALADHGNWQLWDHFYSRPPANPGLGRGTRMGRKRRGLPMATFNPLLTAGLIEESSDPYSRRRFRITDAGRAALAKH